MNGRRLGASGVVAATGVLVMLPNAQYLLTLDGGTVSYVLGVLGLGFGTALVGGAIALYRSSLSTAHIARVAGWNTLGVVVLGGVLALSIAHSSVTIPLFVAMSIVGVSAVAHVIIGITDVRRIRADELAQQRQKLAVLNRLVRHDLRNQAQVLASANTRLTAGVDEEKAMETIDATIDRLGSTNDRLREFQAAIDDSYDGDTVSLAETVESVTDTYTSRYPDATLTVAVPDGLQVRGDEHLATAIERLFEHGVARDERDTSIDVSADRHGGTVRLSIDDGHPIPAETRTVLDGDAEISQLEHAEGLGLWIVKTVVERYGGDLVFEEEGRTVRLELPVAQ